MPLDVDTFGGMAHGLSCQIVARLLLCSGRSILYGGDTRGCVYQFIDGNGVGRCVVVAFLVYVSFVGMIGLGNET